MVHAMAMAMAMAMEMTTLRHRLVARPELKLR
jgi:hypothetical protein